MTQPIDILRDQFGYHEFREGQEALINALVSGCDCVGVMPTGAGKSLCYQVPALLLDGVTLVISPLVSLMHDQVGALSENGIFAAYLNSQLTPVQRTDVINAALAGIFKLLYVAPERLADPQFVAFASQADIPLVAVDEAHCVSQWGQDFRPSYLGISTFLNSLPKRPVVAAFTATATPRVSQDIARLLGLRDPFALTTGFDRPNLRFEVEQLTDKRKLARLMQLIAAQPNESGIVYCSTRKQVEEVHEKLEAAGVSVTRYHAGLSAGERTANQRAFVNDDALVIVATNAFGMGIDKSNVRYVAHYNMPGSLEAYYQEAGRAGRDGEPSTCLLMWNDSDIATCRFFVERDSGNEALTEDEAQVVLASQRRRLSAMTNYCLTTDCLRATILRYFGELAWEAHEADESAQTAQPAAHQSAQTAQPVAHQSAQTAQPAAHQSAQTAQHAAHETAQHAVSGNCGNCSNCTGQIQVVDVTRTARSVMRCVHEVRGSFGKSMVADILTGSKNAKIREYGLERARTYNVVEDSKGTVKEIIELLTAGDYLEISEGRFPLVGLGPRAREAATDEFRLYMKRQVKQAMRTKQAKAKAGAGKSFSAKAAAGAGASGGFSALGGSKGEGSTSPSSMQSSVPTVLETAEQGDLFERLRQLRKQLANEEGVPPYIVFSDAALRSMCALLPATEDEFLQVNGVGPAKLKRYGQPFLAEINRSIGDSPQLIG